MKMQYKVRAAAETGATIARCLTTFILVVGASRRDIEVGVLPFACGQLAYASVLLVVYLWNSSTTARKDGFKLIPAPIQSYVFISSPACFVLC
jgi:oligosaccharide translocation protein RFT1